MIPRSFEQEMDDWYQGIKCFTPAQEARLRLATHFCPVGHPTKVVGCRPYCDTCSDWFPFDQITAEVL